MMRFSVLVLFFLISLFTFSQSATYQHLKLDSIDVSVPDYPIVVGNIMLEGNKVTVDRIIFRELEFASGDSMSNQQFVLLLKLSRQNLLNRSLFNFVDMEVMRNIDNPIIQDVTIKVVERWYIWPLPIFELADRNFNIWWQTKDFSKVNYGIYITHNNFRGRNEKLKLLLRAGYNQNYNISYEMPYITKRQNLGIGFQIGKSRSREIPYATVFDQQLYYKNEEGYAVKEFFVKFMFTFRPGIHDLHNLVFSYEDYLFADSVLVLNPDFNPTTKSEMFTLTYIFKHDYRDSKPYPLDGYYFDAELTKRGLGYFETSPDFFFVKTTFDFYKPIFNRFYWASSLTSKFSSAGYQPYFLLHGLGYGNDFVRSYELYVIDGQDFGLLKNNLKFCILKPKNGTLPLIKTERFNKIHYALYANLLFDAGFVNNDYKGATTRLQNEFVYGLGIGLDLVTYYDVVWRIEYSVNQNKMGGFFMHFMAPI